MTRTKLIVAGLALMVAVVGCRKVSSNKSYNVSPENVTTADLPSAKLIVAVYVSENNVPVSAYLVRTDAVSAILDEVRSGKKKPDQAANASNFATKFEGPSGKLTSPTSDSRIAWTIIFTTKQPTKVTVTSSGE
jgi:hypothetical protein